jgi:hypothetical protein
MAVPNRRPTRTKKRRLEVVEEEAPTPRRKTKRRGGKVAPPPRPQYYMIRITPELIDRVDALRPEYIKREPYIRHILDIGLGEMEEEE